MIEIDSVTGFGRVGHYERKGIYSVGEILPFINDGQLVSFDGDEINMGSPRYKLFRQSPVCVKCGLIGIFFAKERAVYWHKPSDRYWPTSHRYHFNLYGLTDRGHQIMLTKDHIFPKSQGGTEDFSNFQTMCAPCNGRKRDRLPAETDEQYFARRKAEREKCF